MSIDTILKPKKEFKLIRLGGPNDGGYLIGENSLIKTDTLISFGIEDNWQFEKDFKTQNPKCNIYCYDDKNILKYLIKKFIIELIFLPNRRRLDFIKYFKNIIDFLTIRKKINFFQKKIFYNDLNVILDGSNLTNNIFLKIDIEGSEYRILNDIIQNQEKITGIVIEFHDFDYHRNVIYNFCSKLDLDLVHIHPNNYAPIDTDGDPTVIELTFERNPIAIGANPVFPHKLDMKNYSLEKDIELFFKLQ